jgi:vancomycin resistance protein VanJ
MSGRLRVALRRVAAALVVAITAGIVGLALAQRSARVDLPWLELSRYLPYYWLALPAAAGLGVSVWLGRAWIVVGLAAPLALATLTMAPVWASGEAGAEAATRLRLMTYNAKAGTAAQRANGIAAIGAEVARHDPDILVMQDADGLLVQRSDPALTGAAPVFGLPHVYALGQYVVLSRVPLRGCAVGNIDYRDEAHRYLRCSFDVHGTELTVVTAHFKSPRSGLAATRYQGVEGADEWQQNFEDRLVQSRALVRDLVRLSGPLVVAGDLNAAEASPVVQNLLATGLRDAFSAAGRGYGYTYGHSMRAGLSFLRIDHILVNRDIAVTDCFAGGSEASEHRPVIADLSLRRVPAERAP